MSGGLNQGLKSRQKSCRTIVHEFVRDRNRAWTRFCSGKNTKLDHLESILINFCAFLEKNVNLLQKMHQKLLTQLKNRAWQKFGRENFANRARFLLWFGTLFRTSFPWKNQISIRKFSKILKKDYLVSNISKFKKLNPWWNLHSKVPSISTEIPVKTVIKFATFWNHLFISSKIWILRYFFENLKFWDFFLECEISKWYFRIVQMSVVLELAEPDVAKIGEWRCSIGQARLHAWGRAWRRNIQQGEALYLAKTRGKRKQTHSY